MNNSTKFAGCIFIVAVVAAFGCAAALAQSGPARVVSVDAPEMCLRIRSGPGVSYPLVGCVAMGEKVILTGVWSNNNWAEINSPMRGWVSGSQVRMLVVATAPPPPPAPVVEYDVSVPPPVDTYYYGPAYVYGAPYWGRYYRRYGPYHPWGPKPYYYGKGYYRSRGVGVAVGPRGGVAVRAGGVGVRVGPRGGVGVRVR
jgi:uncharacterized protein YraI